MARTVLVIDDPRRSGRRRGCSAGARVWCRLLGDAGFGVVAEAGDVPDRLRKVSEERYAVDLVGDSAEGFGYLLKDRVTDFALFADAVRRVAARGSVFDPTVVAHIFGRKRRDDLLDALTPAIWEATVASPSTMIAWAVLRRARREQDQQRLRGGRAIADRATRRSAFPSSRPAAGSPRRTRRRSGRMRRWPHA